MAAVMMAYPARDSFNDYPQQYAMYQTRAHQPQIDQPLSSNPYGTTYASVQAPPYAQTAPRSSHLSPSSFGDDGMRPSLPSISNLLGIADGDRPSSETVSQSQQSQSQSQHPATYIQQNEQSLPIEHKQQVGHAPQDYCSSQRTAIPPTPPLRNDSVLEGTHSPSTISTGSSLSIAQPYFMGTALNNVEATDQRTVAHQLMKRHSVPSQPNVSPYGNYTASPYAHSPGAASTGSYYSPTDNTSFSHHGQGLYHQRPLPSNFPPPQVQHSHSHPSPPKVLEHHHYINPSSQAQFPQSQDRYICQTCNKAFSRPSSLKIHSHSHTGEKPFKCPHARCGKAFSVRSNMKRHERGCHSGNGNGNGGIDMGHMG